MATTSPVTLMASAKRPMFEPSPWCEQNIVCSALSSEGGIIWMPVIHCPATFPPEMFEEAVSQLIHHPEYNSTLILRSETLSDSDSHFPGPIPRLAGSHPVRTIHRKLLPRRPGRDASLEQFCTLYTPDADIHPIPCTLVLTPITQNACPLPYYHPTVSHLAFRYISSEPPVLSIEVVPLSGTPVDMNSRLYRTCLALLDTLHRYGWGVMTKYKKRVAHDCLVPREAYQDLYLVMRERHKHMVKEWQEVTDPLKHVFEDIGIATFLMLLWKGMFRSIAEHGVANPNPSQPWQTWGRPPGGFLDLGCGNGLLTHILLAEGYVGAGIDLRARTSWAHYPTLTQAHLHVHALDPTALPTTVETIEDPFLKPAVFILGNHADELTPWLPVLSTICSASGYLSIPCCAWTFDRRYDRSRDESYPLPAPNFADSLNLGDDGSNTSSYSRYRIWLASLSSFCGWEVECEVLRIPSTRNWAIIGRRRRGKTSQESEAFEQNAQTILRSVRGRGIFKTRKPEGKAQGH